MESKATEITSNVNWSKLFGFSYLHATFILKSCKWEIWWWSVGECIMLMLRFNSLFPSYLHQNEKFKTIVCNLFHKKRRPEISHLEEQSDLSLSWSIFGSNYNLESFCVWWLCLLGLREFGCFLQILLSSIGWMGAVDGEPFPAPPRDLIGFMSGQDVNSLSLN